MSKKKILNQIIQGKLQVLACKLGSNKPEPAIVEEIVSKYNNHSYRLKSGFTVKGPLHWVRFASDKLLRPRWRNELQLPSGAML